MRGGASAPTAVAQGLLALSFGLPGQQQDSDRKLLETSVEIELYSRSGFSPAGPWVEPSSQACKAWPVVTNTGQPAQRQYSRSMLAISSSSE